MPKWDDVQKLIFRGAAFSTVNLKNLGGQLNIFRADDKQAFFTMWGNRTVYIIDIDVFVRQRGCQLPQFAGDIF